MYNDEHAGVGTIKSTTYECQRHLSYNDENSARAQFALTPPEIRFFQKIGFL